jgi:GTP diphosphokinase / guanosine-3',5'-bis(diphosphate) 3'-diphosphatase
MSSPKVSSQIFKECAKRGMNIDRLDRAYNVALEAYKSQQHWTGIPMISHVEGVLETLLPFEPDEDTVIACLLHHVLDRKNVGREKSEGWTLSDLKKNFGDQVKSMVSGVHLLSHVTTRDRRISLQNLRSMLLKVSDDMRIVLVILCDRCHILDHIKTLSRGEQRRVSADVLHLFAPVAARLGIYTLKHVLEARAFPYAYPVDAGHIDEQKFVLHKQHKDFLTKAARDLTHFLKKNGVYAQVHGRQKEPFSTFTKMRTKSFSSITDIYDLFAFRVIVKDESECYQTLGLLHRTGHPVPNRFKDYIAFPKPNGYQSLHTTLLKLPGVPESIPVEVQIRTPSMHRNAEFGIAAHWEYKEYGTTRRALQKLQLQTMLQGQQESIDEGKSTTLRDHIFVLTPRGDIVELPEGATSLDFAFQIHSEIGLAFRLAKVNGSVVPLDQELQNGDIVEIVRAGTPQATPRWLKLLKTASAKSKLRKHLDTLTDERYRNRDSVISADHSGSRTRATKKKVIKKPKARMQRKDSQIKVDSDVPVPIVYARCCKPQEGERGKVAGVITRMGEVKIHRKKCGMLRQVNSARKIGAHWI